MSKRSEVSSSLTSSSEFKGSGSSWEVNDYFFEKKKKQQNKNTRCIKFNRNGYVGWKYGETNCLKWELNKTFLVPWYTGHCIFLWMIKKNRYRKLGWQFDQKLMWLIYITSGLSSPSSLSSWLKSLESSSSSSSSSSLSLSFGPSTWIITEGLWSQTVWSISALEL